MQYAATSWCGQGKPRRPCLGLRGPFVLTLPIVERLYFSVWPIIFSAATARLLKLSTMRLPGALDATRSRSVLAASYAELNRPQEAERERTAALRISPLLSAERFASQFATETARDHMLEGVKKAGFR